MDDRLDNTYDDTDRNTRDNMRDNMGSDNQDDTPRVAALGDLGDFQVAEGYPDPRGWDVMNASGQKVGKVHDLIVDTGEMRTRYLDIKLDKDAIGTDDDH
ncbi:MAG: PRC-barrel domain-containing protein, partial [Gemmatimonadaceae bacterium]